MTSNTRRVLPSTRALLTLLSGCMLVVLLVLSGCNADGFLNKQRGADAIATRTALALLAAGQLPPTPVPTWTPTPTASPIPSETPVPIVTPVSDVSMAALNPITFTLASPTPIAPLSGQAITSDTINLVAPRRQIGYGRAVQAAIAPGDNLIAIATSAGLAWFDLQTLEHLRFDPIAGGATSVTFSPGGQHVAVGQAQPFGQPVTLVLKSEDGSRMAVLDGQEPVFSPTGQFLATVQHNQQTGESTTKLWRSASGELVATLIGHSPRFSPGGQFVTTSQTSADRQPAVLLWQASDGVLLRDLTGSSPAFSPDRQWLATATADGITLWNLAEGGENRTQAIQPTGTGAGAGEGQVIAFGPAGQEVRAVVEGELAIWNLADDTVVRRPGGGVFAGSNRVLVRVGPGGEGIRVGVSLVRAEDGTPLYEDAALLFADWPRDPVQHMVAFNSESSLAALVLLDGRVRLVNLSNGELRDLTLPAFQRVAFSPGTQALLTARNGPKIDMWQVVDEVHQQQLTVSDEAVNHAPLAFHTTPDGTRLALEVERHEYGVVGSLAILMWDLPERVGREVWSLTLLQGGAYTLRDWDYSPAASAVAWVDENNQVQLRRGHFVTMSLNTSGTSLLLTEPGGYTALAFHPDGELLAIGDDAGTIQIVKTEGGYLYDTLQTQGAVNQIVFTRDGALMGVQRTDGTIMVWPVGQQEAVSYIPQAGGERFVFTPDKQMIITSGPEGVSFYSVANGLLLRTLDVAAQDVAIDPSQRFLAVLHDERVTVWTP